MAIKGNKISREYISLAAAAASIEEQAKSALKDGKFPDGSTPISVERRIWRSQVKSKCIEPETDIDPSESLDYLFEHVGKRVLKHKSILSPRDDIITFLREKHQDCL